MSRILLRMSLCLLAFFFVCSCAKRPDASQTDAPVSDTGSAPSSDVTEGYSTDPERLYGTWKITYYSYDNITYSDYAEDINEFGYYTFYPDGTAIIQNSDFDIHIYHFYIENPGFISYSDVDSGVSTDFFDGFNAFTGADSECLIISHYNITDQSVLYLILRQSS